MIEVYNLVLTEAWNERTSHFHPPVLYQKSAYFALTLC